MQTTQLPTIYPMSAKSIDDTRLKSLWNDENWVAEEKFDGSRYLMFIQPGEPNRLFSRRESVTSGLPVEKTDNVPHLRDAKFPVVSGLTVLDGEIVTGEGCTSSDVVSIMGSLPERAVALQTEHGWVVYKVFDIIMLNGVNLENHMWLQRRAYLQDLFQMCPQTYMKIPKVVGGNKKKAFYEEVINRGGEGVILKNVFAKYQPDKRPTNTWVKVKKYKTFDVVIMGYTEADKDYTGKDPENWDYWLDDNGDRVFGNPISLAGSNLGGLKLIEMGWTPVTRFYARGWIGAVVFGQYNKKGELVEIGQTSGFDDDTREYITYHQKELLGTVMEVGAMEQIKKTGALRHPRFLRFRDDKLPQDCKIGEF